MRNGGCNAKCPLYISSQKIRGVRDSKKDGEAVNKRYVVDYAEMYANDYVEKLKDENGIFVSPWGINMAGKRLSRLSFPWKSDGAASREYAVKVGNDAREYTDRSTELLGRRFHNLPFAFLKDNRNFVAHTPISMASQPLSDLTEPKNTSDAVTKKYVDDPIADNVGNINGGGGSPFFKENGNYQATHAINMAFKKLLNLSTPSELFEAATKDYVDNKDDDIKREVDDVKKTIDERLHIIAVHANYRGPLIKGNYQFAFGGSVIDPNGSTGFLVPQPGRIEKIKPKVKLGEDNCGIPKAVLVLQLSQTISKKKIRKFYTFYFC